jgi:hypothetical protein
MRRPEPSLGYRIAFISAISRKDNFAPAGIELSQHDKQIQIITFGSADQSFSRMLPISSVSRSNRNEKTARPLRFNARYRT